MNSSGVSLEGSGVDLLFARDMLGDNEETRFIAESLTGMVKEFCDIVAANG